MTNKNKTQNYIENILSKRKYDFEDYKEPIIDEILALIPKCFDRFEKKRIELGFSSETVIIIVLPKEKFLLISHRLFTSTSRSSATTHYHFPLLINTT